MRERPAILRIAHRGFSEQFPENTRAAFDAALSTGVDGFETDLQMTSDGVIAIYHDKTLDKFGLKDRKVREVDGPTWKSLDAGSWFSPKFRSEKPLTLDELLGAYGRKTQILLEIKGRGDPRLRELGRVAARAVRREKLELSTWFLSFHSEALEGAQEEEEHRIVLNIEEYPKDSKTLNALMNLLPRLAALSTDVDILDQRVADLAGEAGVPLWCWTVNREAQLETALQFGAQAVMSDRVQWLVEKLPLVEPPAQTLPPRGGGI
ncbi:MAG: glycerophosphodiester phosphodiesterase [Planctomycetota bacterium]